jgi:hypothetical protein
VVGVSGLDFLSAEARAAIEALIDARIEAALEAHRAEGEPASPWLYGAKEAARYIGCSERSVYHRLDSIPHSRRGRALVFNVHELDRWLKEDGYDVDDR